MGPEPLIIPLAFVGLLLLFGAIATAVASKRPMVKGVAILVLLCAVGVFAMTYVSTKTIVQNLVLGLFGVGAVVFAAFPIVVFGGLIILPIKRLFERVEPKDRNARVEPSE
jgi:hypothetical protein